MSGDTLSDLLRTVRLRGAVFYHVEGSSPWVAQAPPAAEIFPAIVRDPIVGCALSLLPEKPAEPWTLERLGSEAGLSRSSLHERFVDFIGQPPMQHVTSWRMQLAAGLLRDTDAKVVDVALDVGYESEAAFCRAFKRVVGVAPGAWRRERRTEAARSAARQPRSVAVLAHRARRSS